MTIEKGVTFGVSLHDTFDFQGVKSVMKGVDIFSGQYVVWIYPVVDMVWIYPGFFYGKGVAPDAVTCRPKGLPPTWI